MNIRAASAERYHEHTKPIRTKRDHEATVRAVGVDRDNSPLYSFYSAFVSSASGCAKTVVSQQTHFGNEIFFPQETIAKSLFHRAIAIVNEYLSIGRDQRGSEENAFHPARHGVFPPRGRVDQDDIPA